MTHGISKYDLYAEDQEKRTRWTQEYVDFLCQLGSVNPRHPRTATGTTLPGSKKLATGTTLPGSKRPHLGSAMEQLELPLGAPKAEESLELRRALAKEALYEDLLWGDGLYDPGALRGLRALWKEAQGERMRLEGEET